MNNMNNEEFSICKYVDVNIFYSYNDYFIYIWK